MFKTHESMSEPLMSVFSAHHRYWRMIERDAKSSWFHATLQYQVEGHTLTRTFMPDDATLLMQLLDGHKTAMTVLELQVVTPASVNQLGRWRMEPLAKLEKAIGADGEDVYLYTTNEGHLYIDPPQESHFDPVICSRRTLYPSASRVSARAAVEKQATSSHTVIKPIQRATAYPCTLEAHSR